MEKAINILEQKAVRITPMRQLLLAFFIEHPKPYGLVELELAFPKADRITMYRTLKTFEEKGIIHSINNETGEVKYALCKEHCSPEKHFDQHPHFHCQSCNQIICLENQFIPKMKFPEELRINKISMIVKGICTNCQK